MSSSSSNFSTEPFDLCKRKYMLTESIAPVLCICSFSISSKFVVFSRKSIFVLAPRFHAEWLVLYATVFRCVLISHLDRLLVSWIHWPLGKTERNEWKWKVHDGKMLRNLMENQVVHFYMCNVYIAVQHSVTWIPNCAWFVQINSFHNHSFLPANRFVA